MSQKSKTTILLLFGLILIFATVLSPFAYAQDDEGFLRGQPFKFLLGLINKLTEQVQILFQKVADLFSRQEKLEEKQSELEQKVEQKVEELQQKVETQEKSKPDEELLKKQAKLEACSAYNTLQSQIKDVCGVTSYPGIDGCIWFREDYYQRYKDMGPEMAIKFGLEKANKLKELKPAYIKAATGCGISLEEENNRSEAYIQEQIKHKEEELKNVGITPPPVPTTSSPFSPLLYTDGVGTEVGRTMKFFIQSGGAEPTYIQLSEIGWYDANFNVQGYVEWNFGDGTVKTTKYLSIEHTYCREGSFTIKAVVNVPNKQYAAYSPLPTVRISPATQPLAQGVCTIQ